MKEVKVKSYIRKNNNVANNQRFWTNDELKRKIRDLIINDDMPMPRSIILEGFKFNVGSSSASSLEQMLISDPSYDNYYIQYSNYGISGINDFQEKYREIQHKLGFSEFKIKFKPNTRKKTIVFDRVELGR